MLVKILIIFVDNGFKIIDFQLILLINVYVTNCDVIMDIPKLFNSWQSTEKLLNPLKVGISGHRASDLFHWIKTFKENCLSLLTLEILSNVWMGLLCKDIVKVQFFLEKHKVLKWQKHMIIYFRRCVIYWILKQNFNDGLFVKFVYYSLWRTST